MCDEELRKLGLRSRAELAEAYVTGRRDSFDRFRNDEGTSFDDDYYAFWRRFQQIEQLAKRVLTSVEIEQARSRLARGVPAAVYGAENVFLGSIEWLGRNLHAPRAHLGALDRCVKDWASTFTYRTEVPVDARIRMTLTAASDMEEARQRFHLSFLPLFKAVASALVEASATGVPVDWARAERLLDVLGSGRWKSWSGEEVRAVAAVLARERGPERQIAEAIAGLEDTLAQAEGAGSFEALDAVRDLIERTAPHSRYELRERLQWQHALAGTIDRFVQLALDRGTDAAARGDATGAQQYWALALSVAEILKSRTIGIKFFLENRIGEPVRHLWPTRLASPFRAVRASTTPQTKTRASRRVCHMRSGSRLLPSRRPPESLRDVGVVDRTDDTFGGPCATPTLDRHLALTYHLSSTGYEAFLDGQVARFVYGDGFRDYAYTPDKVLPRPYLTAPIVRPRARTALLEAVAEAERLVHSSLAGAEVDAPFARTLARLSELLGIDEVLAAATRRCAETGERCEDLSLLVIPDGFLHRVPWAFLRASDGRLLMDVFASVSTAVSLQIFKWQTMSYLWRCLPHLRDTQPRCLFIGAPETSVDPALEAIPGVIEEWKALESSFGAGRVLAFGNSGDQAGCASANNIATFHRDAEVVWFSGHGLIEQTGPQAPSGFDVPRMSMVLPTDILSSEDFHRGHPWNFHSAWMVVLNSCLLGRLYEHRNEMMGLLTALYLVGVTSAVSSLWPLDDDIAVGFASELASRLVSAYAARDVPETEFVRARAFTETLRTLRKSHSESRVASYFYSGVP